jgi:hypothetical protein
MVKILLRDILRIISSIITDKFGPLLKDYAYGLGRLRSRVRQLRALGDAFTVTDFPRSQTFIHSSGAIHFLCLRNNDHGRIHTPPSGQYTPLHPHHLVFCMLSPRRAITAASIPGILVRNFGLEYILHLHERQNLRPMAPFSDPRLRP